MYGVSGSDKTKNIKNMENMKNMETGSIVDILRNLCYTTYSFKH